jgi:hypothetical protein
LSLIARGYTIVPERFEDVCGRAEHLLDLATGSGLPRAHPARQVLAAYTHSAGIESGYGFFAPNVPDSYKLVFELHYADGTIEYDLAGLETAESNLRLAGYLDELGANMSGPMREVMIKLLANTIWRQHPDAVMVRAVLGAVRLPTPDEFAAGQRESDEFISAYDFRLVPRE